MTTDNIDNTADDSATTILSANLPKLTKDQQKAAMIIVAKHFTALAGTVNLETGAKVREIEERACQFFGGRIANVKKDDAFEEYQQPRLPEADKLEPIDRKKVLALVKDARAIQKQIEEETKEFQQLRDAYQKRHDALQKDRREAKEAIDAVVERHNKALAKEVSAIRDKCEIAVAHINRNKSAVEIACLFNGEAKTIGAFLAAMPKGALVAEAAERAGLIMPQIAEKAEKKLALVG